MKYSRIFRFYPTEIDQVKGMISVERLKNWGQMQTVLAVADTGSYRAAGAKLRITSSTVARHIEAISQEIGHPVFIPKGNGWELSDVGKDLVKIADETQTKLGFMLRDLEGEGAQFSALKVSTLSFVSSDFLAKSISLWQQDNPLAALQIDATDQTTAIERGEADIALRMKRPDTPGIARFKVANCFVGIFEASNDAKNAWVGLPTELDHLPEMQMAYDYFGCEPFLRLDSFRAVAKAAVATGMSCVVPTCTAKDYPQLRPAVATENPTRVKRELWFLYFDKRQNDLAIIAARKWIKQVFPNPHKCLCGSCEKV